MFASPHAAVRAYARVGLETDLAAANPHKLILMLFEGARLTITKARLHMQNNDISAKGEAISKAISIIDQGLKASLDVKAGGKLAEKLYALYEYMCQRLLVANLRNQPEVLDEVSGLLHELNEAWASIGQQAPGGAKARVAASPARFPTILGRS